VCPAIEHTLPRFFRRPPLRETVPRASLGLVLDLHLLAANVFLDDHSFLDDVLVGMDLLSCLLCISNEYSYYPPLWRRTGAGLTYLAPQRNRNV
jgi:hypothetical protein